MLIYYWNTIRFLKFRQIYYRILLFFKWRVGVNVNLLPIRSALGRWSAPAKRKCSMLGSKRFRFLNHSRNLEDTGWQGLGCSKLWTYNLHYFDDLNAEGALHRSSWHENLYKSGLPKTQFIWEWVGSHTLCLYGW